MDAKIDSDYLIQLAGNDSEFVLSIIDDFEVDSQKLMDSICNLIVKDVLDLSELNSLLHKFKGSSVSLGMVTLGKMITELENGNLEVWESFDSNELRVLHSRSVALARKVFV